MTFVATKPGLDQPMALPSLLQASNPQDLTSIKDLILNAQYHLYAVARVFFHSGLVHLFDRFPDLDALVIAKGKWRGAPPASFKDFVSEVVFKPDTPHADKRRQQVNKALTELRSGMPKDLAGMNVVMGQPANEDRIYRVSRDNASAYLGQIQPEGAWLAARYEASRLDGALGSAPTTEKTSRRRF